MVGDRRRPHRTGRCRGVRRTRLPPSPRAPSGAGRSARHGATAVRPVFFSKVEQDRTIFTIRASRATRYKEQNRALLEDVWITVHGRDGSRNDNIHTREKCSYEPDTGDVRCEGEVQIDVQNAAAAGAPAATPLSHLEVTTTNLSFDRNTGGRRPRPAPVQFRFPTGRDTAWEPHTARTTRSCASSTMSNSISRPPAKRAACPSAPLAAASNSAARSIRLF